MAEKFGGNQRRRNGGAVTRIKSPFRAIWSVYVWRGPMSSFPVPVSAQYEEVEIGWRHFATFDNTRRSGSEDPTIFFKHSKNGRFLHARRDSHFASVLALRLR